jgi:hypothetical protein
MQVEWSASTAGRFAPRKGLLVPTGHETGLVPEAVWELWRPVREATNSFLYPIRKTVSKFLHFRSTGLSKNRNSDVFDIIFLLAKNTSMFRRSSVIVSKDNYIAYINLKYIVLPIAIQIYGHVGHNGGYCDR